MVTVVVVGVVVTVVVVGVVVIVVAVGVVVATPHIDPFNHISLPNPSIHSPILLLTK